MRGVLAGVEVEDRRRRRDDHARRDLGDVVGRAGRRAVLPVPDDLGVRRVTQVGDQALGPVRPLAVQDARPGVLVGVGDLAEDDGVRLVLDVDDVEVVGDRADQQDLAVGVDVLLREVRLLRKREEAEALRRLGLRDVVDREVARRRDVHVVAEEVRACAVDRQRHVRDPLDVLGREVGAGAGGLEVDGGLGRGGRENGERGGEGDERSLHALGVRRGGPRSCYRKRQ
jgi:hypothetical protein